MNIQQLEADLSARIVGLQDEETKLRRELECLRRLPLIAAEWEFNLAAALRGRNEPSFSESVPPEISEDPFDSLRGKLKRDSNTRKASAFNSRRLLAANG